MIVAVANTKGGTGKTTVAVQLALYQKLIAGRDVWLVDGDEQQSALMAVSLRSEEQLEQILPCSAYDDGRTLLTQVKTQQSKWDDVIIDVGGRDTDTLRAAMMVCDVLLVPVQPRCYDVWALSKLQEIIKTARSLGADFKALCFLSCADSQGGENKAAEEAIANYSELTFIKPQLVRRKAFASAGGLGISVFELKPKDTKACQELSDLAGAVF